MGETLIEPSIFKAVEIVLGEESKMKIAQISLSDKYSEMTMIAFFYGQLALDIKNQLIHKLQNSAFIANQSDESADVAHYCLASLLPFYK